MDVDRTRIHMRPGRFKKVLRIRFVCACCIGFCVMWQLGLCCFLFEFASRKRLGLYLRSKSENLFGTHGDVSNHLTYMGAWRALLLMFASKCQFQGRHKNKPSEILFLIWVEISFKPIFGGFGQSANQRLDKSHRGSEVKLKFI